MTYHVIRFGAAEPSLLMLHGFTGCGGNNLPLARQLPRSALMPDLLGHGETSAPADTRCYAIDLAAQELAGLIRTSTSDACIDVYGYSMGGRLALQLALDHSTVVRSLILESGSPGLATQVEREARRTADEALAARIERDGIPAFVGYWESLPLFASQARLPAERRAGLHQQRLNNSATGLANSLRGMGTGAQASNWDRLTELSMPVLLCAGADDAKFVDVATRMAENIPLAALRVVANAGHAIHLEQPGALARIILEFFG